MSFLASLGSNLLGSVGGIASSALNGVTSLLGTSSANKANKQLNQMNNEFNANEALKNREWQEEMYNKYYSPSALASQYRSAGFNPALMMGTGVNGMSGGSAASASSAAPMQAPQIDFSQLGDQMFNAPTADAQIRNQDASTRQINAMAANQEAQNVYASSRYAYELWKAMDDAGISNETRRKLGMDNFITSMALDAKVSRERLQNERLQSQIHTDLSQAALNGVNAALGKLNIRSFNETLKARIAESYANAYASYAAGSLSKENAKLSFQQRMSEILRQSNISVSNELQNRLTQATIDNMQSQTAKLDQYVYQNSFGNYNTDFMRYMNVLGHISSNLPIVGNIKGILGRH